jgi:hypothetical protein
MGASLQISFFALLKQTTIFYKNNLVQLLYITIVFLIPFFIIDILIFENITLKRFIVLELSDVAYWGLSGIFLVVILILLSLFVIALVNCIHTVSSGEKWLIVASIKKSPQSLRGFFLVGFLFISKTLLWAICLFFRE